MRCLPPGLGAATSTERQPSMASCRLPRSSSMVSPCVAQPGMAGTSAQKPPSSASCTTTLIFMLRDNATPDKEPAADLVYPADRLAKALFESVTRLRKSRPGHILARHAVDSHHGTLR